jgi:hypothetical protein
MTSRLLELDDILNINTKAKDPTMIFSKLEFGFCLDSIDCNNVSNLGLELVEYIKAIISDYRIWILESNIVIFRNNQTKYVCVVLSNNYDICLNMTEQLYTFKQDILSKVSKIFFNGQIKQLCKLSTSKLNIKISGWTQETNSDPYHFLIEFDKNYNILDKEYIGCVYDIIQHNNDFFEIIKSNSKCTKQKIYIEVILFKDNMYFYDDIYIENNQTNLYDIIYDTIITNNIKQDDLIYKTILDDDINLVWT